MTQHNTPDDLSGLTARGLVAVVITSFGYGHGGPPDGDALVLDMRRFRNVPTDENDRQALVQGTGLDANVRDYVLETDGVRDYLDEAADDITALAGLMTARPPSRRRLVDVAVGCSGGRHRSVAGARHLAACLAARGIHCEVEDRDVEKDVIR